MVVETPMVFSEKIAQTLGVKLDVIDELFNVDEDRNGYFVAKLKPKKFLDKMQFRALCALVRDLGGEGYIEGAKAWKIAGPLAKVSKNPSVVAQSVERKPHELEVDGSNPSHATAVLDEDTEVLRGSAKKIGYLYPILEDTKGNIIDGFHRVKADPKWPRFMVDRVDGPVELEIARLVANTRRDVPAEEKTKGLKAIVEMTGWSPKQLAENLGWSERTVFLYLPSELKDQTKAQAGALGGQKSAASLAAKSEDLRQEDYTEGKIREILATPKGQEVLASITSETRPTSPSESIPSPTEEPEKKEKPPKESRKPEEIDTGFEWVCPECQEKFQLIHIKNVDGKTDHRLEAKFS